MKAGFNPHPSPLPSKGRGKKGEGLLYNPQFEHDGCGTGFVVDISGRPSHSILDQGIQCVVNLTHRGAIDADAKTGDGAGVLTQIPRKLFDKVLAMWEAKVPAKGDLGIGVFFFPTHNPSHAKEAERRIFFLSSGMEMESFSSSIE